MARLFVFLVVFVTGSVHANTTVNLCNAIGNKLSSVAQSDCKQHGLTSTADTQNGHSLAYLDLKSTRNHDLPTGRVLLIGGIHGDEFSSVSIVFKWLDILQRQATRYFDWRIIPVANPDGLLSKPGQRQNINGIDLNRNFPTENWLEASQKYWLSRNKNPRRFPGNSAASELETQWLIETINDFKPDVIISVHAPYSLLDFDGPPMAPTQLGSLKLNQLGVYPGSLGNYGSKCLARQVVTLELESAGSMPSKAETKQMWRDLVRWLVNNHQLNHSEARMSTFSLNPACKLAS